MSQYCEEFDNNSIALLSDLPEATFRAELDKIAVLAVRDGGLILRVITAVAVSRAIARLLLHIRTCFANETITLKPVYYLLK